MPPTVEEAVQVVTTALREWNDVSGIVLADYEEEIALQAVRALERSGMINLVNKPLGIRQAALNLLDEIDANPPLAVIERLYARIRTTLTEAQTHDNDPRV